MRLDNILQNITEIIIKDGRKPQKYSACKYENKPGKRKKRNVKINRNIARNHGTADILTLYGIEGILKTNLDK